MEAACIRHTDLPHTTRLFADLVYHFDRVAPFYGPSPADHAGWASLAAALRFPAERRAALVAALRAQNGSSPALDKLARNETVAVVTGQQVGLFSGPCYTIYKALTACRLARQLSASGVPAVPVFWLATEDHDLAEVNHTWAFDATHHPRSLRAPGPGKSDRPVGGVTIEAPPLDALRQSLAGFPFGEEVAALVEETYRPGETFGAAFHNLLRRLLADDDLLYLDPLAPAVRDLAAPFLREAVHAAADLGDLILARNQDLNQAGYHAQVHFEKETSLFFLLSGGQRIALRRQNGDYVAKDRRLSVADLQDSAAHLSPNALLRPVLQDYILPTVAYVGGPAELAYLAQAQVIYRSLLGRMPVAVSRSGFTLLDARAGKLMDRYGLRLEHCFHGEEALRDRIAGTLVPPQLSRTFDATATAVTNALDRLDTDLRAFDPSLAAALGKSRAKILYQLSKTQRKASREALQRDERATADAAYLYNLVYPEKHLQERFYGILPFLARHGTGLIQQIGDHVRLDCPDHNVLLLG